jgi:hypothetical protein
MLSFSTVSIVIVLTLLLFNYFIYDVFISNPLSAIPGPKIFALSSWRLALEDWRGTRTTTIYALHLKYGPVVRVGPNEVSFNNLSALRTIYGAGSGFERTNWYRCFDVYGKMNLFSFSSVRAHAERKRLMAQIYSKSNMMSGSTAMMVEEKVRQYLELIENEPKEAREIFKSLHYFSLDSISYFLYGEQRGTKALTGNLRDRALLDDILSEGRQKVSWFSVHLPAFTDWVYSRTGLWEQIVSILRLAPVSKANLAFSGIRTRGLENFYVFKAAPADEKNVAAAEFETIMSRLWKVHQSQKGDGEGLDDLEIASECSDQ